MEQERTGHMIPAFKPEWLQRINHPAFYGNELQVDMLRLDLMHPLLSGNKWLKLDFWLKKYHEGDYTGILTLGGPWSNHLHATAFACKRSGIALKVLVKGHHNLQNAMLRDLKDWKTEISFVNRETFYDTQGLQAFAEKENLLMIPMGGEGEEGREGVTNWFNALPVEAYDAIWCAVGTGTTLAGIALSKLPFSHLVGVDPGTGDKELLKKIQNLNENLPHRTVELIGGGQHFGKLTAELAFFLEDWNRQTGFALDMVYTGPLCQSFVKTVQKGQLPGGARVLLIHTGGLQGNRSHSNLPV